MRYVLTQRAQAKQGECGPYTTTAAQPHSSTTHMSDERKIHRDINWCSAHEQTIGFYYTIAGLLCCCFYADKSCVRSHLWYYIMCDHRNGNRKCSLHLIFHHFVHIKYIRSFVHDSLSLSFFTLLSFELGVFVFRARVSFANCLLPFVYISCARIVCVCVVVVVVYRREYFIICVIVCAAEHVNLYHLE